MKEVIRVDQLTDQKEEKKVEFTHCMEDDGWEETKYQPSDYDKVVYLGKCKYDGDMFASYHINGTIITCKGHLNSGKY